MLAILDVFPWYVRRAAISDEQAETIEQAPIDEWRFKSVPMESLMSDVRSSINCAVRKLFAKYLGIERLIVYPHHQQADGTAKL